MDAFSEHRTYLFSLAYRLTGSAADAEDLVQETFLRWRQSVQEDIRSPRAFLTTVLTRLAVNHLESARVRREEYVGSWLPEPVITSGAHDAAVLSESLTMAFLLLLETLNPLERAVFLLHEVFDYSHAEVAEITGKTEEGCRQTLHRAKQGMGNRRPRFSADTNKAEQLTTQFFKATQAGAIDDLLKLLHDDIVAYSDGGGQSPAALRPIYGKDRVARFLIGIARKGSAGLKLYGAEINRQQGILGFRDGAARTAVVLDIEDDSIRNVYIVVNPDKLQRLPNEEAVHTAIVEAT